MKLLEAPTLVLCRPAPARAPDWAAMSARTCPMPSLTSSTDCALTNCPRPLIAACHKSSTPELSGWKTLGDGTGHCNDPAVSAASVTDCCAVASLPLVPSDTAAKFWCSQVAGSVSV